MGVGVIDTLLAVAWSASVPLMLLELDRADMDYFVISCMRFDIFKKIIELN